MKIELCRELSGRILDIGGGGEGVIGRIYGHQVTAIDKMQEELDDAPDGFEKLQMDAAALDFQDTVFDHVTSFYTLMFMGREEQENALAEAARVLKPGGRLHIWDADIVSAYPEPFLAELDIDAAGKHIHTTYGVGKLDTQNDVGIIAMCKKAGLVCRTARKEEGHFFLCFEKGA